MNKKFVKKIPSNSKDILVDPLALAVWYLDDGTKQSDTQSCRIATNCFSKQEHVLQQRCIQGIFNISVIIEDWAKIKSGRTAYDLAILSRGDNFKKFRDVIYDVVNAEVPSMLYKL